MKKTLSSLAAVALTGAALAVPAAATANDATAIDLQPESVQQTIDGFGYSAAFQRTHRLNLLSDEKKAEAVELLLGDTGVDPSILRLGIGGQSTGPYDWMLSIQPDDPGGPDAEPNYQWDGYDNGQVWFAQAAEAAGVEYIYGNAWTAPGYMKTNNSAANGGTLCGLSGTACPGGDWTDAYANYLVAWADFYADEGVGIDGIAFTNEPDYTSSYESMRFTPQQAVEFTKTAGPVFDASGYDLLCCESFGWNQGKNYHSAIQEDSEASQWVDVLTAHSYASRSDSAFETDKPLWMSEWAASVAGLTEFNANWDGNPGAGSDGIRMVDHMMDTLMSANATGYLWWLGVSQGGSGSLMVVDPENDTFTVGSRLYGMAAFSRFIRPDAVRFDAVHAIEGVKVAAFDNADGSRVVQVLNNNTASVSTDIDIDSQPTAYLNDQANQLVETEGIATTADGRTTLELPARSLVTLVVEPGASEGDGEGIPIEATVPGPGEPGSLSLTVADFGAGVVLSPGENAGDRIRFEGELPVVTVTDSRSEDQAGAGGWAVSGQSSDFTAGGETLGAEHLQWTPEVLTPRPGVSAGDAVATVMSGGPGLADPQRLGDAAPEGRFGSTQLGADLALEAPVDTPAGTYEGVLTVTLFPED
ncbi:glycoside hydrolase [Microbacterium sp. ET2]|uniref:glycoside hydrolase family 30 protein n=1 Tax=Microbacterium albipurpureum TaxID=3050384 RepID=UPI00259D1AEA|nr:glycoside hydrolase [Microbacterium sp. ET2 (Ac-2212)]WJL96843.1 glycoside hydrolase [Microbacterium sp. ET2 (Ac-2212)]